MCRYAQRSQADCDILPKIGCAGQSSPCARVAKSSSSASSSATSAANSTGRVPVDLLIDLRACRNAGRPRHGQVQRDPLHQRSLHGAGRVADGLLAADHAAGVAEVADHLMRRHRPPAARGLGTHRSQPANDLRSACFPRERLHVFTYRVTGRAPVLDGRSTALTSRSAARHRPRGTRRARAAGRLPRPPAARGRQDVPQRVELRAARERRAPRSSPWRPRAGDASSPVACSPTSHSSQPSWKIASGSSWIFSALERRRASRASRPDGDRARPSGSRSRSESIGMRDGLRMSSSILARLVAAAGQSRARSRGCRRRPPATTRGRLDRQEPIDIAGHQQRLLEARGDVRIEPARLGMRGDRLVVQAAVAARVDEPGEELRIVAVAARPRRAGARARRCAWPMSASRFA